MATDTLTSNKVLPRLLPAKRAAQEVGIPYTSLRDAVHRGELGVVKVASAWYFERRDIDRWIEARKERG